LSSCRDQKDKLDLIITNASIWTGNEKQPYAQSMAIVKDKIFEVDPNEIRNIEVLQTYVGGVEMYKK